MGASASKHHLDDIQQSVQLSRCASFPSYTDNEAATSEKSLCTPENQNFNGNDICEAGVSTNRPIKERDLFVRVKKSDLRTAIMNGLDRGGNGKTERNKKHRMLIQSAPASPLHGAMDEAWVPVQENKLRIKVRPVDETSDDHAEIGTSSFRCTESLDASSGLKLLLSPVTTPSSRSVPASSRFANITKNLSSSGRLDYNPNDEFTVAKDLNAVDLCEKESDIEGMGDSEEPVSPLFDPSILATFERAIEATSDDNWQASEASTSSSSRIGASASDICSDADSPNWSEEPAITRDASSMNCLANDADESPVHNTEGSIHNPVKNAHFQKDYLEDFELKCPAGCEEKIVLYFTSLRGIRKTYENCCLVRTILKGFGVPVDARDIWMHSKFKEELMNVMGAALAVPSLFIKGRYIGGAEDVKRLHEDGILEHLLEGFPAECNSTCECCGDVRFVPCSTCSGSCKMISIDEISRCPDCNENGLILCPACGL